ncbi:MAG: DegT/DnrJ/EryC1/StrS family aminotransferase [Cyclobacteriaceae bacterium]
MQTKAYFYPCIHLQPYYANKYGYSSGMFPIAEMISHQALALPFYTAMTEAEADEVMAALSASMTSG